MIARKASCIACTVHLPLILVLYAVSFALQAWVAARKESDFSKFAPFLQQWVDVNKQKAAAIDPNLPAYDVLLDDYETGMTSARLDEIFAEVRIRGLQWDVAEPFPCGTAAHREKVRRGE